MPRMDQPEMNPLDTPLTQHAGQGEFAKDPVCGMQVDTRTAQYTANYAIRDGSLATFYFCSDECKQMFEREPERYAKLAYTD
ncbi:MAG TPA: YHS domain-containing protein [Ktedonobacterales bacterium]